MVSTYYDVKKREIGHFFEIFTKKCSFLVSTRKEPKESIITAVLDPLMKRLCQKRSLYNDCTKRKSKTEEWARWQVGVLEYFFTVEIPHLLRTEPIPIASQASEDDLFLCTLWSLHFRITIAIPIIRRQRAIQTKRLM